MFVAGIIVGRPAFEFHPYFPMDAFDTPDDMIIHFVLDIFTHRHVIGDIDNSAFYENRVIRTLVSGQ